MYSMYSTRCDSGCCFIFADVPNQGLSKVFQAPVLCSALQRWCHLWGPNLLVMGPSNFAATDAKVGSSSPVMLVLSWKIRPMRELCAYESSSMVTRNNHIADIAHLKSGSTEDSEGLSWGRVPGVTTMAISAEIFPSMVRGLGPGRVITPDWKSHS